MDGVTLPSLARCHLVIPPRHKHTSAESGPLMHGISQRCVAIVQTLEKDILYSNCPFLPLCHLNTDDLKVYATYYIYKGLEGLFFYSKSHRTSPTVLKKNGNLETIL